MPARRFVPVVLSAIVSAGLLVTPATATRPASTAACSPKATILESPRVRSNEVQAVWRTGWTSLKRLPIPRASRKHRVVIAYAHDINSRGRVVGNVFGLTAKDFGALRRIDPVVWTCAFG